MNRNEFLKRLGASVITLPLFSAGCDKENDPSSSNGACETSPSETAGPFPTKSPASLVMQDIRSDREGVPMSITITIQNKNNNCSPLEGALVDIWHCDKDGYYSEYGGSGMQPVDLTGVHFLRGRQASNTNGQVSFQSIFPGWYSGRAPHIHVHVYEPSGKSLLVTQIAFETAICNSVYTTATEFYKKGTQDTSNERDNVFADSLSHEMSTITGSIDAGFALVHTIVVEK